MKALSVRGTLILWSVRKAWTTSAPSCTGRLSLQFYQDVVMTAPFYAQQIRLADC